jgi:FkbM family methyltransferase
MENMKKLIQRLIRRTGYQLEKYPQPGLDVLKRFKIMGYCNINTLFDIGANNGQYASEMRQFGYKEKIISFEPLKSAFSVLKDVASKDNNWVANNYAIGNENTKSIINIAGNKESSSILEMLPMHYNTAPESKYIAQEEIEIKKLDSIFDSFCRKEDRVMIKIDTQGFEKNVIDGAEESLNKILIIQLEMSLVPLYKDEMLFIDMINYLDKKGFQLFSLENGFSDRVSGRVLQVDGIFVKKAFHN